MADADIATTTTEPTNGSATPPPPPEPERLTFTKPEFASRIAQAERAAARKIIERAKEAGVEIKDADDLVATLAASKQTKTAAAETVETMRVERDAAKKIAEEKDAEALRARIELTFDRHARALGAQHPELLDRAFDAWCEANGADPLEMAADQWQAFGAHARAVYPILFAPPAAPAMGVATLPPPAPGAAAVPPGAGGSARTAPAAAKTGEGEQDLTPEELAMVLAEAAHSKAPLERVMKIAREQKTLRAGALNPTVWSR